MIWFHCFELANDKEIVSKFTEAKLRGIAELAEVLTSQLF